MSNEKSVFTKGSALNIASNYVIAPNKKGLKIIRAHKEAKTKKIKPLSYLNDKPDKQSKEPNIEYAPHIHLQNINLNNKGEILKFVNIWGLLHLWKVENYKYKKWTEKSKIFGCYFIQKEEKKKEDDFLKDVPSEAYKFEEFQGDDEDCIPYCKKRCEPLKLFKNAAAEYQNLARKIKSHGDNNNLLFDITAEFKLKNVNPTPYYDEERDEWDFGWEYPSLYHAIYLLTYLDLVEGDKYQKCENDECNNIFIPTNKNDYCSENCRIAQNTRESRIRKAKVEELWKEGLSAKETFEIMKEEFGTKTNLFQIEKWFKEWNN